MTKNEKERIDELVGSYRASEQFDVESALSKLHHRLDAQSTKPVTRTMNGRRRVWFGIAASFLLLVTAANYYFATSLVQKEYVANNGILNIALPDGSEVVLNQGSQLSYGADYGDVDRRISLEGEAYFSVQPDANRPMLIAQEKVQLRVVGTTFNLRAVPEKDLFEVEVSSGKIVLEAGDASIPVAAKEVGTYSKDLGLNKSASPHLNRHAWKTGELVFVATPFSEAIKLIESAYGVVIKVSEEDLKVCDFPITASFSNVSLTDVLVHLEKLTTGHFLKSDSGDVFRLVGWCDK